MPMTYRGQSLYMYNGSDGAEIFLPGEAGAAIGAFIDVNTVNVVALDNSLFRTNPVPDTGKTLNALFANPIFHDGVLLRIDPGYVGANIIISACLLLQLLRLPNRYRLPYPMDGAP